MSRPVLHQMTVGATPGDAITDHALMLRRWLRQAGYDSHLFADSIHPSLQREVRAARHYRPAPGEQRLIYHHSTGTDLADRLVALGIPLLLVYHNVTPAHFFADSHPALAREMVRGEQQLLALRSQTEVAIGVSDYNRQALEATGFARTEMVPLALNEADYQRPPDRDFLACVGTGGPTLLFVGRIVPNKRQEDLLKLLFYLRRQEPDARLLLMGEPWAAEYAGWLEGLARDLDLADSVTFLGHQPHGAMVTAYRTADLYVSMSEHEGFGKPLIESMLCDLPVLAYAAGGVPSTLGGSGVLFHQKRYDALAEVVRWLVTDQAARARLIARQQERVRGFLEPQVRARFLALLHHIT